MAQGNFVTLMEAIAPGPRPGIGPEGLAASTGRVPGKPAGGEKDGGQPACEFRGPGLISHSHLVTSTVLRGRGSSRVAGWPAAEAAFRRTRGRDQLRTRK